MRISPSTALAIGVGGVVLVAWLVPIPVLVQLRWLFLDWAVLLSGVALVLAFVYFLLSLTKGLRERRPGALYRLIALVAGISTFALLLVLPNPEPLSRWLLNYILIPGMAALLGLLAVVMTYRLFWIPLRYRGWLGWVFVAAVVLLGFLYALAVWMPQVAAVGVVLFWVDRVLVRAGIRGLLLGMALAVVALGFRLVTGIDRPYEE